MTRCTCMAIAGNDHTRYIHIGPGGVQRSRHGCRRLAGPHHDAAPHRPFWQMAADRLPRIGAPDGSIEQLAQDGAAPSLAERLRRARAGIPAQPAFSGPGGHAPQQSRQPFPTQKRKRDRHTERNGVRCPLARVTGSFALAPSIWVRRTSGGPQNPRWLQGTVNTVMRAQREFPLQPGGVARPPQPGRNGQRVPDYLTATFSQASMQARQDS